MPLKHLCTPEPIALFSVGTFRRRPSARLDLSLCSLEELFTRVRKGKADSTRRSSRAVPHPSTNRALRRLTSEVRRDPVYSTRYGRQRK